MRVYYKVDRFEDDTIETECRLYPFCGSSELEIREDGRYEVDCGEGYTLVTLYKGALATYIETQHSRRLTSGTRITPEIWKLLKFIYV